MYRYAAQDEISNVPLNKQCGFFLTSMRLWICRLVKDYTGPHKLF